MFYDVAIIGAGPCGLAVAARLREKTPSALFTNEEHSRYWRKHKRQAFSLESETKKRKVSTDSGYGSEIEGQSLAQDHKPSIVVLDSNSNEWLSNWKQRFAELKISHLRSPLFFHPDPRDRDGLLAFAHEQERPDELREIPNVVGRELSKHETKQQKSRRTRKKVAHHLRVDGRDQIDYFTPSSSLFEDYCESIIDRYNLRGVVQSRRVLDIGYDQQPANLEHGLFTIQTDVDEVFSRCVIIATGAGGPPKVPCPLQATTPLDSGSFIHCFQPEGTALPRHIKQKVACRKPTNVLIVGGGLTSAQLVDLFIARHNVSRVHLLIRSPKLKVKHFDVDLSWVTKTRNHRMAEFWSADTDEERLEMFREARDGGSINPPFHKILQKHVQNNRLSIYLGTELIMDSSCVWDANHKAWTHLNISPEITALPPVDHIVYATGNPPKFENIPFLQSLRKKHTSKHPQQ